MKILCKNSCVFDFLFFIFFSKVSALPLTGKILCKNSCVFEIKHFSFFFFFHFFKFFCSSTHRPPPPPCQCPRPACRRSRGWGCPSGVAWWGCCPCRTPRWGCPALRWHRRRLPWPGDRPARGSSGSHSRIRRNSGQDRACQGKIN